MPDNQVIDIQLQSSSPIIQMEIEKSVPQEPQVQLVDATKRIDVSGPAYVVISSRSTRTVSFSEFVPTGYSCVGYNKASLEDISGTTPTADIPSNTAYVLYRNNSTTAIGPLGHDTSGWYYTAKATLICVKDGVLE